MHHKDKKKYLSSNLTYEIQNFYDKFYTLKEIISEIIFKLLLENHPDAVFKSFYHHNGTLLDYFQNDKSLLNKILHSRCLSMLFGRLVFLGSSKALFHLLISALSKELLV